MTDVNLRSAFLTKNFPHIGKATVDKMFAAFSPHDLLEHIKNKNDEILRDLGISERQIWYLHLGFVHGQSLIKVAQYLDSHAFSKPIAPKVHEVWGSLALDKIRKNPYRLLAVAAWDEVDKLGLQRGPAFHPARLVAAIENCAYEDYELNKNTCINKSDLLTMVKKLIGCNNNQFNEGLTLALDIGSVIEHKGFYQIPAANVFERRIESFVANNPHSGISAKDVDEYLNTTPKFASLTDEQRLAVKNALLFRISAFYGRGGRGKTYTLSAIAEGVESLQKRKVVLAAVAAKACRRIQAETGRQASTIAYLLHAKNGPSMLENSMVIVDEASMISLLDFYQLVRRMPSTSSLVLLGDPYQIPSVDAGRVFYDIIKNNDVPRVELTINKRQDKRTDEQLENILAGTFPVFDNFYRDAGTGLYKIVEKDIASAEDRAVSLYIELSRCGENVQIISPLRKYYGGSDAINQKVHMSKFNMSEYCNDTPVVWTKNVRTESGNHLTNGSVGVVLGVNTQPYELLVRFDQEGDVKLNRQEVVDYLEKAYCLTVHKGQGSEWDTVIIVLPTSQMVDRNMVYTALSRCRKRAIVVYSDYRFVVRKVQALPAQERRKSLLFVGQEIKKDGVGND